MRLKKQRSLLPKTGKRLLTFALILTMPKKSEIGTVSVSIFVQFPKAFF